MALKEREIQERVKKMGFERGVMFVLLEQAGETKQLEKAVIELSRQLDQMVTMMDRFVTIAGNMKEAHQRLLRMVPPEGDLPRPSDDRDIN